MKYLITSGENSLSQRIVQWLQPQLTEKEDIFVLSKEDCKKNYEELEHPVTFISEGDLEKLSNDVGLIIYVPSKKDNLAARLKSFEDVLTVAKKSSSDLIFVSFFADQEENPYIFSPFYAYAYRRLAGSGIKYTVVKNAIFADIIVNKLPYFVDTQRITYPLGLNRLSFITENDSAHAIAKIALTPVLRQQRSYLLTMERNYNMLEIAYVMQRASEKKISYQPDSYHEYLIQHEKDGLAATSLIKSAADGFLKRTSDDFHRIMGREPEELEHFVRNGYQISKLHALNIK